MKHRRRKHRRNAEVASLKSPVKALTGAFHKDVLVQASFVIGGNLATSFVADKITGYVDILGKNKVLNVGTTLLTAGGIAALSKKVAPHRANEVLIGGMLAGLTKGLKALFPATFGSLQNWSDDGLSNWSDDGLSDYVDPRQIATARNINDYVDPRQIATARNISDYVDLSQVKAARNIDGMDAAVSEEIEMQSY